MGWALLWAGKRIGDLADFAQATTVAAEDEGAPHADVTIPGLAVSPFELRLSGRKQLSMTPAASVLDAASAGQTVAPALGRVSLRSPQPLPLVLGTT